MTPGLGDVLGGRYTLTDRIAAGGMGDVWAATDRVLGRTVAIKIMRPNTTDEGNFAARFRDEARHTAALSHPNIAAVYDYGEDDGTAYLVMELVPGLPLSSMIAEGPMPPEQVRLILGQCALALAAAHEAGVVHRDVKPANVMVTPEGKVKLTDFGIARAVDAVGHTRTGEVMGTPQYLAPEQAMG
ncbi:MAG TPA: serine/threonine-protein kinase, partial [Dermatophilaceae bacterium]|nr:serine/threonine-protein kinase [Dermatophilaceae bacterium]